MWSNSSKTLGAAGILQEAMASWEPGEDQYKGWVKCVCVGGGGLGPFASYPLLVKGQDQISRSLCLTNLHVPQGSVRLAESGRIRRKTIFCTKKNADSINNNMNKHAKDFLPNSPTSIKQPAVGRSWGRQSTFHPESTLKAFPERPVETQLDKGALQLCSPIKWSGSAGRQAQCASH